MVAEAPTQIGELEILRRLGSGGFGAVYLARDRRLARLVAVKVAHPGRGDLSREARAAARLAHPNVVAIHELGEHAGSPYLVMEYIDGPTLREQLDRGRMSSPEARRILGELAAAIAAAHREGLVHLDLTPANVLLAADGRARVVDFGLARTVDTADVERAGTPAYMAPEQWRGERTGAPADVWALGAIAHALVTGTALVEGATRQIRDRVAAPDELALPALAAHPAELAALIRACVRKDPAARPLAGEVCEALASMRELERGPFDVSAPIGEPGRPAETAALVELVQRGRAIAVTGVSGAGVTSLVVGGLVPALRADGWRVVVADARLASIAAALHDAVIETARGDLDATADPVARWTRSPELFAADLADAASSTGDRLVLVIDPCDARGALVDTAPTPPRSNGSSAGHAHDLGAPLAAALADDSAVRIVLCGRVGDRAMRAAGIEHTFTVGAPAREDVAAIVERTAAGAGARLEAGLARQIADDTVDEPGALALVQLVGAALWAARDRDVLTRAAYGEVGGPLGALADHLRRRLARWSPAQVASARELLVACARGSLDRDAADPMLAQLIDERILVAREHDLVFAHRQLPACAPLAGWLERPALERSLRRPRRAWLGVILASLVAVAFVAFALLRGRAEEDGPECSSLRFTEHALLPAFNAPGRQDAIGAISMDGKTVAQHRRDCGTFDFSSLVIDDLGDRVIEHDLTHLPVFAGAHHHDGYMAMTADALTLIMVDRSLTGFIAATRSARGLADFVPNDAFARIRVTAPVHLRFPVISADGLALYYARQGTGQKAVDGIYESLRESTEHPFEPGVRMSFEDVNFHKGFVTGISGDRLALFVQYDYAVFVLSRARLTDPFTNPNYPVAPPAVPGFRTRPYASCTKLIGTCVNGCNNEDSCAYSR